MIEMTGGYLVSVNLGRFPGVNLSVGDADPAGQTGREYGARAREMCVDFGSPGFAGTSDLLMAANDTGTSTWAVICRGGIVAGVINFSASNILSLPDDEIHAAPTGC